jgi:hypothetical protein
LSSHRQPCAKPLGRPAFAQSPLCRLPGNRHSAQRGTPFINKRPHGCCDLTRWHAPTRGLDLGAIERMERRSSTLESK